MSFLDFMMCFYYKFHIRKMGFQKIIFQALQIKTVLIHVNGVSPKIKEDRFFAHVIDFSELFKS